MHRRPYTVPATAAAALALLLTTACSSGSASSTPKPDATVTAADEPSEACADDVYDMLIAEASGEDTGDSRPDSCAGITDEQWNDVVDEAGERALQADDPAAGEDSGDTSVDLTAEVEYTDGTTVSLDNFTRGTSGQWAEPAGEPYVAFTIKVTNGGDGTMDLNELYVSCQYGDNGRQGEQIFDSDKGLDGGPTTHLRPGRSITTKAACQLPKGESYTQIEVSPGGELQTAIFAGDIE